MFGLFLAKDFKKLLAFFGFMMAVFAGGWVSGDKVAIIIGLLLVAIGFLITTTFTSLMVRHINKREI